MNASLASLLLFLVFPAHVLAAGLLDAYRQAQADDAVLASATAAYRAGIETLPQARSLLLPSVVIGADTTRNDMDIQYRDAPAYPSGRRGFNSNGITLSLVQPVYRPQNLALYEQGKLRAEQAETRYRVARQEVILRVSQAYFDVLLARDTVNLERAQKKAILAQLERARLNFKVGTATITDSNEAQARYDLAEAAEIVAVNDLDVKRRILEKITGTPVRSLSALSAGLPLLVPQPADPAWWADAAERDNLQVRVSRAEVDIAAQEVARNRRGHLPTLDLVASYGESSAGSGSLGVGNTTRAGMIGLQLNVPLYQGGLVGSRVREAVANHDKAGRDLDAGIRQARLAAHQAYLGVANGIARIRALGQALVSSQSALDSSRLGMDVGVRTNVDVLNAQRQVFGARRDLYQARYQYLMSMLNLKSAVGALREDDLLQIDQWLE